MYQFTGVERAIVGVGDIMVEVGAIDVMDIVNVVEMVQLDRILQVRH